MKIQGNGVPSTSTVGNVDDVYTDLLTDLKYKCVCITTRELYKGVEKEYTWELLPPWEQIDPSSGPPGPQGPQGPKGDKGDPGADGQDGAQGPQGPAGANGADGEDGGYYTPAVDTSGNLSWTGSKEGMASVPSVNIKGPQGEQGAQGIQGPAGATGPAGTPGDPSSLLKTGYYVGDGTETRTINLGFTPRAVLVLREGVFTSNPDNSPTKFYGGLCIAPPAPATGNNAISIVSNGFSVRYVDSSNSDSLLTNVNGTEYIYLAFK